MIFFGSAGSPTLHDVIILLLVALITLVLTAITSSYVRLARRRPWVMLVDVLASLGVVWLSGGGALPYLPYALGSLVLLALQDDWVEALVVGLAFTFLDIGGLLVLNMLSGGDVSGAHLALRAVAPLGFIGVWALLGRLPGRVERTGTLADLWQNLAGSRPPSTEASGDPALRASAFADLRRDVTVRTGELGPQQRSSSQMLPAPRSESARHAIYDPAPGESLSFPAAVDLMALNLGSHGSAEMRLITLGVVRPLTGAQHSVLLRAAHEALLNIHQHSHASSALITISFEPQAVTLTVQDDGVGLLDGTYERPGMHALRAVRYRLAELEGQLAVFESDSGGVTLRATLPLDA
ncbi:hypothetical protein K2Z83_13915 [Oscillochloris sp. ZM17-4]|uniref:sensor histidine kinase n=1 Tax=Oscillochloris sp. ZM17-4 TaxID=2866714 RepID=UPI001C73D66A|nr:hypothetical protein [Oscillochloris sp. ZM17-4]MBX0328770.1 hypothetical protein [Oscillochloris sp. ZM17-4]